MKPTLITLISLFILSSCTNDDDSNVQKEIPINYYFVVSSVLGAKSDDDRIVEFEIDGIKHQDIAPCSWSYRKFTTSKETHVKVNLSSKNNTNILYEVRKNVMFKNENETAPGKWINGGSFRDQLDTIVKIK